MTSLLAILFMVGSNALVFKLLFGNEYPLSFLVTVIATLFVSLFVIGAAKASAALRHNHYSRETGRIFE